jgi:hypothetical protein
LYLFPFFIAPRPIRFQMVPHQFSPHPLPGFQFTSVSEREQIELESPLPKRILFRIWLARETGDLH